MKRSTIFIVILCSAAALFGQDSFSDRWNELRQQGYQHYLVSNRHGIQQVLHEMKELLTQQDGIISAEALDSLRQDTLKLHGDYEYELSDYDTTAYARAQQAFTSSLQYYDAKAQRQHYLSSTEGYNRFLLHQELAQLYYKQGRYSEALTHQTEVFELADNFATALQPAPGTTMDPQLDITAAYALCLARTGDFQRARELISAVADAYEDRQSLSYGEALRKQAKILMLQQEAEGGSADEAVDCYRRYFKLQKHYATLHFLKMTSAEREQYWMAIRPFVTDCYRLEDAAPELLYDVTLFAKGLLMHLARSAGEGPATAEATAALTYTWQQIQEQLSAKAAAIEFIQYEKGGHQRMGALLLQAEGKPQFLRLTDPDHVLSYLVRGKATVAERLFTGRKRDLKNAMYTDTLGLWPLVWPEALTTRLATADQVFFAPDGYMHQLAIEYMFPPQEGTVPAIYRLTSTRQLMAAAPTAHSGSALICGGIKYVLRQASPSAEQDNDQSAYHYMQRRNPRGSFRFLEKSLPEAQAVAQSWGTDSILSGAEATEEAFTRSCTAGQTLVHVVTHGVFTADEVPQATDLKPGATLDERLSQCMIIMAGATGNITNPQFDSHHADGLLSAREIATLNMNGVQLFVVSACETGMGQITNDGVYGIQRGLKNAGVGAIIVSLWEVQEETTSLFMTHFYQNLREGMTIHQAFDAARTLLLSSDGDNHPRNRYQPVAMNQTPPENTNLAKPENANAFILIDATQ